MYRMTLLMVLRIPYLSPLILIVDYRVNLPQTLRSCGCRHSSGHGPAPTRTISPDRTESQSQPQLEEEKHNMLADDGANEGALDGICDASDRYSMCGVRQCRQLAEGLQYLAYSRSRVY